MGCGASTKIIMNMMSGTIMAMLSEAMSLAEKAGLDQYTMLEIVNNSQMASSLIRVKGDAILQVRTLCFCFNNSENPFPDELTFI